MNSTLYFQRIFICYASDFHHLHRTTIFSLILKMVKETPMCNQDKLMLTNSILCNKPNFFSLRVSSSYNWHKIKITYILNVQFNKFLPYTYTYKNHYENKNNELIQYPQEFLHALLYSFPYSQSIPSFPGNYWSTFFNRYTLVCIF